MVKDPMHLKVSYNLAVILLIREMGTEVYRHFCKQQKKHCSAMQVLKTSHKKVLGTHLIFEKANVITLSPHVAVWQDKKPSAYLLQYNKSYRVCTTYVVQYYYLDGYYRLTS